ncbi:MAG: hypothetical protein WC712_03890 [Candidatus Brocadiia bacterium]
MNSIRHGLLALTLLAAGMALLVFPVGCARRGANPDVLVPGLPVALYSRIFAVNADETAYATGDESGIVIELSLPDLKFRTMWNLGVPVLALFRDADKYIAIADSGIYSLHGSEKKRIGDIPQGDRLSLPPELSGTKWSVPLVCRDGRIMWFFEADLEVVLFSTDVTGNNPRGYKAGAVSFRVVPGAEWAIAMLRGTGEEWLVTPDGLTEVVGGAYFVAMGHRELSLQYDDHRLIYSPTEKKFTRVDGVLMLPPRLMAAKNHDCFASTRGCFIGSGHSVWASEDEQITVQDTLEYCRLDGENLYLVDKRNNAFVRATIGGDRIESIPADGEPIYFDSECGVTLKDKSLYINGRPITGQFSTGSVRRCGRVLLLRYWVNACLVDLDALVAEQYEMGRVVGNESLVLIDKESEGGYDSSERTWVAVNPRRPSERLEVDMHGESAYSTLVLDDRIIGLPSLDWHPGRGDAFEFDVDFPSKRATLLDIPHGSLFSVNGLFLDPWVRNQALLDSKGRAIPLPAYWFRDSGHEALLDAEQFDLTLISHKGSQYIRCGCNFVRIGE